MIAIKEGTLEVMEIAKNIHHHVGQTAGKHTKLQAGKQHYVVMEDVAHRRMSVEQVQVCLSRKF